MIRRLTAVIGILLLISILIALIWTVHRHRSETRRLDQSDLALVTFTSNPQQIICGGVS